MSQYVQPLRCNLKGQQSLTMAVPCAATADPRSVGGHGRGRRPAPARDDIANQRAGELCATGHCGLQAPGCAVEGPAGRAGGRVRVGLGRPHHQPRPAARPAWMEPCVPAEVLVWEDGRMTDHHQVCGRSSTRWEAGWRNSRRAADGIP